MTQTLLKVDYYKTEHPFMMPSGLTKLYSNLTPRKSRIEGVDYVVVFMIRHTLQKYLVDDFNTTFFKRPKEEVMAEYKRHVHLNDYSHIERLHGLQYLPIEIKALPEGTRCPIGVPLLTITNTLPEFAWLVNYLETLLSCSLWQGMTSATIANEYRILLTHYALLTTGNTDMVQWQGHDFSMRGMSSVESAVISGMSHLLSFTGTDTVPAIYEAEKYYDAAGLIGASVPATEHSIEMIFYDYANDSEQAYLDNLLLKYPTGIFSMVSDGKNLWKVITELARDNKDKIMSRDGKVVFRPDSGDPVDIICGIKIWEFPNIDQAENSLRNTNITLFKIENSYYEREFHNGNDFKYHEVDEKPEYVGVIDLLYRIFGGKTNDKGFIELDPHVGAIYGDSITLDRAKQICERLMEKRFASTNIVLGIGSYTYQYNTRDTFGFAVKATYGEVDGEAREIFKDPITDNGTKKSKKGLLGVFTNETGGLICTDCLSKDDEKRGLLETVFCDGNIVKVDNFETIRKRLSGK